MFESEIIGVFQSLLNGSASFVDYILVFVIVFLGIWFISLFVK